MRKTQNTAITRPRRKAMNLHDHAFYIFQLHSVVSFGQLQDKDSWKDLEGDLQLFRNWNALRNCKCFGSFSDDLIVGNPTFTQLSPRSATCPAILPHSLHYCSRKKYSSQDFRSAKRELETDQAAGQFLRVVAVKPVNQTEPFRNTYLEIYAYI
jgi:hypothetical protein